MARYIDADELIRLIEIDALCNRPYSKRDAIGCVKAINSADVVPKSEAERWRRNLEAVLEEIAETKKEVAREIFAEIERTCVSSFGCFYIGATHGAFAELKKKYTERDT